MSNTFNSVTKAWAIDETGELNTDGVEIQHIIFNPNSNGDQLVITDDDDNPWIHIWGKYGGNTMFFPFAPPIKLPGLKIATLSGSSKAIIQFRTDLK